VIAMSYGLLLLRVVLGLTMAGHGSQKLFGAFGGGGPRGTGAAFDQLRFRAPVLAALAAGLAELGSGVLLATGLLTPLAALLVAIVMLDAIAVVHWRNGFWNASGGYEYTLVIWAAAVALAAAGGGRFSLDRLIGWDGSISGLWWGVGVIGGGALVSGLTVTLGRHRDGSVREPLAADGEPVRKAA
jgi:putative oxidoreductase